MMRAAILLLQPLPPRLPAIQDFTRVDTISPIVLVTSRRLVQVPNTP